MNETTQVKHTPGNWTILAKTGNHWEPILITTSEDPEEIIAEVRPIGNVPEQEGNANLIIGAPDLYKELAEAHIIIQKMLNLMTAEQIAELSKIDAGHGAVRYYVRKDALAKAEGR